MSGDERHEVKCADGSTEMVTEDELEAAAQLLDDSLIRAELELPRSEIGVAFAQAAIDGYAKVHDEWNGGTADDRTNINDLLTDLRHWAKAKGLDFGAADSISLVQWEAEQ